MNVHRFVRHDVDAENSYLPWPPSQANAHLWPPERLALMRAEVRNGVIVGYHGTRRSEIAWATANNRPYFGRMDIILINEDEHCECRSCGDHHIRNRQYVVEPGPNGTLRGDVCKLSSADKEWALEESRKCWDVDILRAVIR